MNRIIAGLSSVVLGIGGVAVASTPAHAACYGDYCSGKNPEAEGCSGDAYSVASARIPGTSALIELRWSPSCKTEWARVPASWGTSYPSAPRAIQCSTGYTQAGVVQSNSSYSWTRMIYSPSLTVRAAWSGAPGSVSTACW